MVSMRSFLKPTNQSTSSTPQAAKPASRLPSTPSTGGDDDVVVTAELKLALADHGGRERVPTKEGELAKVLVLYRDNGMALAAKRAQPKGMIHLLSVMEKVCVQTGDWAAFADRGNDGNLDHLLGKHKAELARMQELANEHGKAHLAGMSDGRKLRRLQSLVQETSGFTGSHKLYSTSEGHIGKLNESLRYMGKWLEEESASKLKQEDVIIDRFEFAALNIHKLRALRDSWVTFASALIAFYNACKKAHASACDAQAHAPPPAKRQAVEPASKHYVCVRDWDATKAPKRPGQTFLPIVEGDELILVSEEMGHEGWAGVKRQSDGITGWVPFQRIKERPAKPSFGAPELSDDDDGHDEAEQREPPDLEDVQGAVEAALEDGESFTLDTIMEDLGGFERVHVQAALDNLQKHGPPNGIGVAIVFDSARGVYRKVDDGDDEADESGSARPFTEEELLEFLAKELERNKEEILAHTYHHRNIYTAVDAHFSCDIREMELKKYVKRAFMQLVAELCCEQQA